MGARELITQLNQLDEHQRLEAKRATDLGRSVLETICAFSNEPGLDGGCILLGVVREEDTLFPAYEVIGVSEPDKLQTDLASQCRSMFNIPIAVSMVVEEVNGKLVLLVHVPEAQPGSKPVFLKATGLPRGAYRRIGSADVRCSEEDLAILYQGRRSETYDSVILEATNFEDVDQGAVEIYRRERARSNATAEELQYEDREMLSALGCARLVGGNFNLTVAGLMLFGRNLALRRLMPMIRVDYIRVAGREWVPSGADRYESVVELRGPLLLLLPRAQAAILDDLPKAFHLPEGALQRAEEPALPLRVVREALVNALMHRSYRDQNPTQIIRYANRLEFRNPGFSLKAEERLGDPGSEARNPFVAGVLHDLNFAETKGTGIRTMKTEMQRAGLSYPYFESDRDANRFTATFLFHHFLDPSDVAWLGRFKELDLTDDDCKVLIFVREAGRIDNRTFRELVPMHPSDATHALRRLREMDLLDAVQRTSARFYVPGSRLKAELPHELEPSRHTERLGATAPPGRFESSDPLSEERPGIEDSDGRITDNTNSFDDKPIVIAHKGGTIAYNETGGENAAGTAPSNAKSIEEIREKAHLLRQLPPALALMLEALGRRTDPDKVKTAIVALCGWKPMRVAELCLLLGRSRRYTWDLVQELETATQLAATRPETPRHPDQAYRRVNPTPDAWLGPTSFDGELG